MLRKESVGRGEGGLGGDKQRSVVPIVGVRCLLIHGYSSLASIFWGCDGASGEVLAGNKFDGVQ